MKVLVFGGDGQLGQVLRQTAPPLENVFVDRRAADLTQRAALEAVLAAERPQVVVNAAAFTGVDAAEVDAATAFAVNEAAPAVLAERCRELGARLVHLSTDLVFDGALRRPYRPDDAPGPLNVYGRSKLAGEQRLRTTRGLDYLVVRTSWLYSGLRHDFVLTLLDAALRHGRLRVVDDQVCSPTSAWTLAVAIWRAVGNPDIRGTGHFTDGAGVSRREFVDAILATALRRGLPVGHVTIEPVSTEQWVAAHPGTAARPNYSVLDDSELRACLDLPAPDWKQPLDEVIRRYSAHRD